MPSLMHIDATMLAFQVGAGQLNTFEAFLHSAVTGIESAGVIAGMLKVSYVIMLIGFLWELYQSALGGGDVRALGRSLAKYTATAFVVQAWPDVFVSINSSFVAAGAWMTHQGGVGNVLDSWLHQMVDLYETQGHVHMWNLVTGEISGLLDAIVILVSYLIYPLATVIFGFFYLLMGSILFVTGPLVVALFPFAPTRRIATSYIQNVFIWNAWPILYGALGLLITAVHLGDIQQTLLNQSFLGAFAGLEGVVLIGFISLIYSVGIAVIPFIAKSIVQGEAASIAGQLLSAATTALTVGAAAVAGAAAGASAGAAQAGGAGGANSGLNAGANSASKAAGNQPAPAQPLPANSSSPSSGQGGENSPASSGSQGGENGAPPSSGDSTASSSKGDAGTTSSAGENAGGTDSSGGVDGASSGDQANGSSSGKADGGAQTASGSADGGAGQTGSDNAGGPTTEAEKKAANNLDTAKGEAGAFKAIGSDGKTNNSASSGQADSGHSSSTSSEGVGRSASTPAAGSGGSQAPSSPSSNGSTGGSTQSKGAATPGSGAQTASRPSQSGSRGSAPASHAPSPRHGLGSWGAYHAARIAAQGAVGSSNAVQRGVSAAKAAGPEGAGKVVGSVVGGAVGGVQKGIDGAGKIAGAIASPGKTVSNAVQGAKDAASAKVGEVSNAAQGFKNGFNEGYASKTTPPAKEDAE